MRGGLRFTFSNIEENSYILHWVRCHDELSMHRLTVQYLCFRFESEKARLVLILLHEQLLVLS